MNAETSVGVEPEGGLVSMGVTIQLGINVMSHRICKKTFRRKNVSDDFVFILMLSWNVNL